MIFLSADTHALNHQRTIQSIQMTKWPSSQKTVKRTLKSDLMCFIMLAQTFLNTPTPCYMYRSVSNCMRWLKGFSFQTVLFSSTFVPLFQCFFFFRLLFRFIYFHILDCRFVLSFLSLFIATKSLNMLTKALMHSKWFYRNESVNVAIEIRSSIWIFMNFISYFQIELCPVNSNKTDILSFLYSLGKMWFVCSFSEDGRKAV